MSIELDQLALDHIVPSTRDGFVIVDGMKVKTVLTDKPGTVREIYFHGDANDGGFVILVEDAEGEGEEYADGELYMDQNGFTRSSFCEVCFLHFDEGFVE